MHVSGLFIYPVKSLRGISLQESEVGPRGLQYDRNWMVVDENGRFRTQRQIARMAQISVEVGAELRFSAAGCGAISVPIEARGETVSGAVWNWVGPVDLVDVGIDQWLSEVLEMPCRLVRFRDEMVRAGWGGSAIAFPDGAPVLVAGEESLSALNADLADPVPMDRFRANVIVARSEAYGEDEWSGFEAGSASLRFAKRCGRCLVTTTDQRTGDRHAGEEPLRTLVRTRLFGQSACFGSYYVPERGGVISTGDPLKIW